MGVAHDFRCSGCKSSIGAVRRVVAVSSYGQVPPVRLNGVASHFLLLGLASARHHSSAVVHIVGLAPRVGRWHRWFLFHASLVSLFVSVECMYSGWFVARARAPMPICVQARAWQREGVARG